MQSTVRKPLELYCINLFVCIDLMDSDNKEKDAEMQKLYDAIGYSQNEVVAPFPKEVHRRKLYIILIFSL